MRLLLQTLRRRIKLRRILALNADLWAGSHGNRPQPFLHQTSQQRRLRIPLQQIAEVLLWVAGDKARGMQNLAFQSHRETKTWRRRISGI